MKRIIVLLMTLFIMSCSTEAPEPVDPFMDCRPELKEDLEMTQEMADPVTGLIQGDIIPDKQTKGAVVKDVDRLWEGGVIRFYFREEGGVFMTHPESEKKNIRQALRELDSLTVLTIIEYEDRASLEADGVDGIRIDVGVFSNSSYLGRQGGIQPIKVTFAWNTEEDLLNQRANTKHEFLHAAGLLHEFTMEGRDEYLIINYDNIYERYHRQFDIHSGYEAYDCYVLDLKSIMMYDSFAFAIDKSIPTMTTLDGRTFKRNRYLSVGDIGVLGGVYYYETVN